MVVVVVEGWGDRGREKRQFRATDRHGKELVSRTARRLLSDVWDYSFFKSGLSLIVRVNVFLNRMVVVDTD